MRITWQILVWTCFLISCGNTAIGQESTSYTITVAYFKSQAIPDAIVDNFVLHLSENLKKHNIEMDVLGNYSCCAPPSSIFIAFRAFPPDSPPYITVNVGRDSDPLHALSPLLMTPTAFYRFSSTGQLSAPSSFIDLATGVSLYAQSRCDLAVPYFTKAGEVTDLMSQKIDALVFRGNCAILQGDYGGAVGFFENAVEIWTGEYGYASFEIAMNLGWVYIRWGKPEQGLDIVVSSIYHSDEVDFSVYAQQIERTADLYAEAGYYEGAISYLTELMNSYEYILPEDLTKRAHYYALNFQYEEAISDINAAIELDPDNPELYVLRGQIVLLTYEWDAVLADYNKALELDPDYADAYFYRGVLFYTQGPRERALEDFRRYLELAPEGEHAEEAAKYIESIEAELEALGQ